MNSTATAEPAPCRFGHRRDGLSGTAYVITQAGCDAICSEPNVDDLDGPAAWNKGI